MKKYILLTATIVSFALVSLPSLSLADSYDAQKAVMEDQGHSNSGEEMDRLDQLLKSGETLNKGDSPVGTTKTVKRVSKNRRVHNSRQNVNGIQGKYLPRKTWEPRPEPSDNSLIERMRKNQE